MSAHRCIASDRTGLALCGQRLPVDGATARAACYYCLIALDARIKREHARQVMP